MVIEEFPDLKIDEMEDIQTEYLDNTEVMFFKSKIEKFLDRYSYVERTIIDLCMRNMKERLMSLTKLEDEHLFTLFRFLVVTTQHSKIFVKFLECRKTQCGEKIENLLKKISNSQDTNQENLLAIVEKYFKQ